MAILNLECRLMRPQIESLKQVSARINKALQRDSLVEYIKNDLEFHTLLVSIGCSYKIRAHYEKLILHLYLCCYEAWLRGNSLGLSPAHLFQLSPPHHVVIDAIETADWEWAQHLVRQQIKISCQAHICILEKISDTRIDSLRTFNFID